MSAIDEFLILFRTQVQDGGLNKLNSKIKSTRNELFSVKNLLRGFIGYDIYSAVRQLIPSMVNVSQQLGAMKSRFNAVSTSAKAGAEELNWVGEQSKRLGLNFLKTADDYSIFFATVSKNMGQKQTREVFEQWAEAFRVLHIDPERQSRVLYALREMSSKGKIYMQDLALQLGSSVPDAMNLAATAMGYTGPKAVEEFRQAIKDGEVDVKKFIPLFSKIVNQTYVTADALKYAMEQTDAQLQLIQTHWTFFQKKILEAGLQDDIVNILKNINSALSFLEKHASSIFNGIKLIGGAIILIMGTRGLGFLVSKLPSIISWSKFIFSGWTTFLMTIMSLVTKLFGAPFMKMLWFLITKPGGIWVALSVGLVTLLSWILNKFYPNIQRDFFLMVTRMHQKILEMIWSVNDAWNKSLIGKVFHIKTYGEEIGTGEFAYMNDPGYKRRRDRENNIGLTPFEKIMQIGPLKNWSDAMAMERRQLSQINIPKIDASITINTSSNDSAEDIAEKVKDATKNTYQEVINLIGNAIPGSKSSSLPPFSLSGALNQ